VEARIAPHGESQRRQRCPTEEYGVERVAALVRLGRGVRRLAGELDVEGDHREHERVDLVAIAGVVHERGVDVREDPRLDERDLAVAALLRGAADDPDASAQLRPDVAQREKGACCRRPHEVVPARVTDAGQRVVLGAEREDRTIPAAQL
jgi:hypothetical protein